MSYTWWSHVTRYGRKCVFPSAADAVCVACAVSDGLVTVMVGFIAWATCGIGSKGHHCLFFLFSNWCVCDPPALPERATIVEAMQIDGGCRRVDALSHPILNGWLCLRSACCYSAVDTVLRCCTLSARPSRRSITATTRCPSNNHSYGGSMLQGISRHRRGSSHPC